MSKETILKEFELFSLDTAGIGGWINEDTSPLIFDRLLNIENNPLSKVQLNQLLVLGHEAPLSDGVFKYYWTTLPEKHEYDCASIPGFNKGWTIGSQDIGNLEHLKWGLYRLYVDGLLHF